MADILHPKGDVAVLKSRLIDAELKRDATKYRNTVQKIVAFMTLGIDVSSLFTEMIKASATQDLVQKKLAYLFLCSHAETHSDLALLAVNTLVKDAQDDNAMVRGLALRSMLNLRIPSVVGYIQQPLLKGLIDRSSYVKRNAVLGCIKLHQICPEVFYSLNIVPSLQNMVYDPDAQVSFNSLAALEEILGSEGSQIFSREMVQYLLERLYNYSEWSQCLIMHWLTRYVPSDLEETLYCLNVLDSRLKHTNKAVVMAAVGLFIQYSKNYDAISSDVLERVRVCLLSALSAVSAELLHLILSHFKVLLGMKPRLFHADYKIFFIKSSDATYVQQKKLELLVDVVTEGNVQFIIDELIEYVLNCDPAISKEACSALSSIACKHSFAANTCLDAVLNLMANEAAHITAQCLEILQELVMCYKWIKPKISGCLVRCLPLVQDLAAGKGALIWLMGECGEDIPEAPYYVEQIVDGIEHEHSSYVKLQLLCAAMKLFFKRPPECQHFLGRLIKFCIDDELDMDVRDRAMLYYRSLVKGTVETEALVCSVATVTGSSFLGVPKEDLKPSDFNTLQIVYGPSYLLAVSPSGNSLLSTDRGSEANQYHSEADQYHSDHVYSPALPEAHGSVLTGDLLGAFDELSDALQFDPNAFIDAASFELIWGSASFSSMLEESLERMPVYENVLHVMKSKNLHLIASSVPADTDWKFYFYAKIVGNMKEVLIEAEMLRDSKRVKVVSKSEDATLLDDFEKYMKSLISSF